MANSRVLFLVGLVALVGAMGVAAVDEEMVDAVDAVVELPQKRALSPKAKHTLDMYHSYKEINIHLENSVQSDDVALNMAKAGEWLTALSSEDDVSPNLIEALQQFLAMQSVQCDQAGFQTLDNNGKAARLRGRRPAGASPRRVEVIFEHYRTKHANECESIYLEKLHLKLPQLEADKLAKVQTFTLGAIEGNQKRLRPTSGPNAQLEWLVPRSSVNDFFNSLQSVGQINELLSVSPHVNPAFYHAALDHLAKEDPDHHFLFKVADEQVDGFSVNKDKVKELFERHLHTPCQHYVEELGPEILDPALFDSARVEPIASKSALMEVHELRFAEVSQTLCRKLLGNWRTLKGIVEFITMSSPKSQ